MQRSLLPKLLDDRENNNYGEWETKAYHILCSWDLTKYIESDTSYPPEIPPLWLSQSFQGTTDQNVVTTVHVRGNQAEHDLTVTNALPWTTGNNLCLSKIVNAVPNIQLHLV